MNKNYETLNNFTGTWRNRKWPRLGGIDYWIENKINIYDIAMNTWVLKLFKES